MGDPVYAPKNNMYSGRQLKDSLLCAAIIETRWSGHQCLKYNGYGPDGFFCKQHANKIERDGLVTIE